MNWWYSSSRFRKVGLTLVVAGLVAAVSAVGLMSARTALADQAAAAKAQIAQQPSSPVKVAQVSPVGPWPQAAGASAGSGDQQVQPLSLAFVVMVSAAVVIVAGGGRRKNRPRSQTGYLFGKDAR